MPSLHRNKPIVTPHATIVLGCYPGTDGLRIHEILPRSRPGRPSHFWEGLDWEKKLPYSGVFQEKAEISLCRAMLVTEGVHRAPSL